ncbi:DUF4861 family protein [candidate division KSB1 bacterium]
MGLILFVSAGPADTTGDDWYGEADLDFRRRFSLTIINHGEEDRPAAPVEIEVRELSVRDPLFRSDLCLVVDRERGPLTAQADDIDGDFIADRLVFQCDLGPNEQREIAIYYLPNRLFARDYPAGVDAGLWRKIGARTVAVSYDRVPPGSHGGAFHRLDGPAWESETIGYRFYLDSRAAGDIFGKHKRELVLKKITPPGVDYLKDSEWGRDILVVGESLGLGGFGVWDDGRLHRPMEADSIGCRVLADGPVRTVVATTYYGWRIGDLKQTITAVFMIWAGNRHTSVTISPPGNNPDICLAVGIVRTEDVSPRFNLDRGWLYTRGLSAVDNGELVMALTFPKDCLLRLGGDEHNHLALLKRGAGGLIHYRFAAFWDGEPDPLPTRSGLENYLSRINRLEANLIGIEEISIETR